MRALVLLVAFAMASGFMAGCVNTPKDNPTQPTTASQPGTNEGGQVFRVLAPLATSISTAAPKWLAPGAAIDVNASAPANAKGGVTWIWAAGALPGTVAATAPATLDTGSKSASQYIASGGSKPLTYSAAGIYQMHCHPHAFMRHNVTVIDGYAGPKTVNVHIVDGATPKEFRYVPENIVIGVGTTVVYHNNGTQPHTTTVYSMDHPPLKLLPLKAASGQIALTGDGWQRVHAYAIDGEGRLGNATLDVYVSALPTFAPKSVAFEFPVGGLPPEAVAPVNDGFVLAYGGTVFLNFTAQDVLAQNGGPANLALVDVHLTPSGSEQDAMTSTGKAEDALSAKLPSGSYTLTIAPTQGILLKGTVTIEVVYDLASPPAPAIAHDDAGGGGHHH